MEVGPERDTLQRWLNWLRYGIIAKVTDLDPEALERKLVVSGTTLGGIVTHLTEVEIAWFQRAFLGVDVAASTVPPGTDGTTLAAAYRRAIARSEEILESCSDLDQRATARLVGPAEPMSMRWILTHMVQETARHSGHVDILREQIDGHVGL